MPGESSASDASKGKSKAQDNESQVEASPRLSHDSLDSVSQQKEQSSPKSKSGMRAALSKAARRFSPSSHSSKDNNILAGSEEEFAKMKKREVENQKRKDEYVKYNLGSKGFGKGSMQMGG